MIEDSDNLILLESFLLLNEEFLEKGASLTSLRTNDVLKRTVIKKGFFVLCFIRMKIFLSFVLPVLCSVIVEYSSIKSVISYTLGIRCLLPNSYLVWEFTRPVSNCDYCEKVGAVEILENLTEEQFKYYTYSSRPIVVKNAASNWLASKVFSLKFLRDVYNLTDGLKVQDECQFLQFRSNFANLNEVFGMSENIATNLNGANSWYVGWKNCHPEVLDIMNQFYEIPDFLPRDAEIPCTNYIFLGYDQGAAMHVDYIPRLMWQGQLIGNKTWTIAPSPECDHICKSFKFLVETGDVVLLDTRMWYHSTCVENKRYSLTITLEYG